MEKQSKIYVAGHRGLVGGAIVSKLKSDGYTNLILKNKFELDLRNQSDVLDFFNQEKPEYVFQAAAKVGGIKYNDVASADFIRDNLMIQTNVLDASHKFGVKKFQFLGSACIYPKVTPQPIDESYLLTGPLEPSNDAYAIAKIAGLMMCRHYRKQYGFNAISLMPANLYGPKDNFDLENSHVIPGLIHKFYLAKMNSDASVTCWGDGTATREFLYIDDLADACVFLMNNYDSPNHINVGGNDEMTIRSVAETIKEKIGFTGILDWDTTKPNGTPRRKLNTERIESLGWNPTTSFDLGLENTIDWFISNYESLYDEKNR